MLLQQSALEQSHFGEAPCRTIRSGQQQLSPQEETRSIAFDLIRKYGYNTTAFFAFNQDKQLFLSYNQEGCISYIIKGNTVIVIGDPLAPQAEMVSTIHEFLSLWRGCSKHVVFWQTREDLLPSYQAQALHTFKIGEDAIIDLDQFTLKGNKMSNVRSSAHRAEKEGIQILFLPANEIQPSLRAQMGQISQQWLSCKGNTEMGFSMGRLAHERGHEQIFALALDSERRVQAFVSFVPIYARNGWALDLLRRADVACPGVMELLLVRAIAYFQEQGASILSLGLVPMSNQNKDCLPPLQRVLQRFLHHSSRLQKYKSLVFFKNKFRPRWENRYFTFSSKISLPQSILHVYRAHCCKESDS